MFIYKIDILKAKERIMKMTKTRNSALCAPNRPTNCNFVIIFAL